MYDLPPQLRQDPQLNGWDQFIENFTLREWPIVLYANRLRISIPSHENGELIFDNE